MRLLSRILVALLLACPLYVAPGAGYDAIRLPAALAAVAGLLALLSLAAARGYERPPTPAPLRTAGLLLLTVEAVSVAGARSFADAAPPLFLLFSAVSAFACLRGGLLRRDEALGLLPVISAVGLAVALVGIGQRLCRDQAVSTEGNRNYAGALAAMLLPAAVAFVCRGPRWSRILAGISSAALLALLLLTEHRGGLIGAVAGLLVAAAALGRKRVPRGVAAAAAAILLLVGIAAALQGRHQLSAERLETAGFRMDVWRSGLSMLRARPVLGWGAGGFQAEYPEYRSESEFRYSHKYTSDAFVEVEDAHSSWVQTAVECGGAGLFALLLVAYVAARIWRHAVRMAPDADRAAALAGLGGGAAAYLVAGLFNSLTLKSSPTVLFWCFLGLVELIGETRTWRAPSRAREWRVAVPAAAALLAAFGALWAADWGLSDRAFTEGMSTSRPEDREAKLREALDLNPYSWRAHYQLSLTLSAMDRLAGARDEALATLRLRPLHVEALNQAAVCLVRTEGDEKEAESLLRRATQLAPYYYKSFYNLGLLELRQGRTAPAREHFTRCLQLHPASARAQYCRGRTFLLSGDTSAALEDFRRARTLGVDVAAALRAEHPSAESDARFAEFFR